MFKFIRKIKAKKHGIRFSDKDFWPPFYISFTRKNCDGCYVLNFLYDAKVGDIVKVLQGNDFVHSYILKGIGRASGDDHIVSPKEFNIEYHHSERILS